MAMTGSTLSDVFDLPNEELYVTMQIKGEMSRREKRAVEDST